MRRISAIDVIICVGIAVLAALTLAPAVARMQRNPAEAKCQANLQRIAEAIDLYLEDYRYYPTNRQWIGTQRVLGPVNPLVNLSPNPAEARFVYGVNWVEGLYDYTRALADRTGQDEASFWHCPNASSATYPLDATGYNPRVNYAFNPCLAERPRAVVPFTRNLMMLRETGRLAVSLLRPSNPGSALPNGNSAYPPQYPFLNSQDRLTKTVPESEYLLHSNGSFIVFADGHVKHFTIDYYPEQKQISASRCWDSEGQRWYNYFWVHPTTEDQLRLNKTIAISP